MLQASPGVKAGIIAAAVTAALAAPLALRAAGTTGTVGFLISDYTTSARWQFDKTYFIEAMKKLDPGINVVVDDAQTDQTRQQTQATSLLTSGAKVLLDVPVDSTQAGAIVRAGHDNKPRVPVIAYDRLISGADVDAYATFDPIAVGRQQAQYIIAHVKPGATIVSIAGAETDNNGVAFHKGAIDVLQPLVKAGKYKLVYDKFTPNWSASSAQAEMASALNNANDKVDAVLVANDGMAAGVIAALRAQHLAGKVIVTGQDATVAGLQDVLTGEQSMTIYKPIRRLATAAAEITDAFLKGEKPKTTTVTNNGSVNVPTVLLRVVTVTKANIKSTVLADGYVTKAQLCENIPASACAGL